MASLVDQIFQQAEAGSAQGQGFGQYFAQGVQAGQNQQRINQEKQRLAMELAQLPLKQTLLQQETTLKGLAVEQGLQSRQNYIDSTQAFTGLSGAVSEKLKSGELDGAVVDYTNAGLSNNFLLTDPRYQALGKQLDQMQKEADLVKYRKDSTDARLKAADVSSFRAKPTVEKLLLGAQQAEEDGDKELADSLRSQATLERDKLAVRKQELAERARRNDIRKDALDKNLNSGDKMAFSSRLRDIENAPRMTLDEREAAREKALSEYEAKTKGRAAGGTGKPAPELRLGTVVQQGGKKYRYQGGDTKNPASYVEIK